MLYLVGILTTGPARRFPGPFLGNAVDKVASAWGWLWVLLPQAQDLKRRLTWSGTRWLQLWLTLLCLLFSIKWGILPGQLGEIRLCWNLLGINNNRGKEENKRDRSRDRESKSKVYMEEKYVRSKCNKRCSKWVNLVFWRNYIPFQTNTHCVWKLIQFLWREDHVYVTSSTVCFMEDKNCQKSGTESKKNTGNGIQ